MDTRKLARGLGWFSVGLGLMEIMGTKPLARALGMQEHEGLLRFFGLRELTAGIGLLTQEQLAPWLWGRVAGDALDLAALGFAFAGHPAKRTSVGIATGAVAGVTALDVLAGRHLSQEPKRPREAAAAA